MKTLSMIKMEKNFIAQEKGYPRKPYEHYSIEFLLGKLKDEVDELFRAISLNEIEGAKIECADVSNVVDFIFERLSK